MSTFCAIIVENSPETRAEAARLGVVLTPKDGHSMIAIRGGDFATEAPRVAAEVSARVSSPVLAVVALTSVDAYGFEEFLRGDRLRGLLFNRDHGGWQPSFGEPRPWEAKLHFALPRKQLREDLKEDEWSEAEIAAALQAFDAFDPAKLPRLPRASASQFAAFLKSLGLPPEAAGVLDRRGWLAKLFRFG